MRVVAGTARGRRLVTPDGRRSESGVRPTTDRVRESIFNALHSRGAVVDARVLDLFAGTGALGLEALSRGAAHATFVEQDPTAVALVETNLEICNFVECSTVVCADGPRWLDLGNSSVAGPWDLVLLDPPYDFKGWSELLDLLVSLVAKDAMVVVESDHEVDSGAQWHVDSHRRAAGTVVTMLRPDNDPG